MSARTFAYLVWSIVAFPALALAQETPAEGAVVAEMTDSPGTPTVPSAEATPTSAPPTETPVQAPPVPDTPPGYEGTAVPTPPEHATPAPHAAATTTEPAHEAPLAEDANVELALTINGLLSFSSTTTPVLVANADLAFALDPRAWIGLGIAFSYAEQHTTPSPGIPDMKFVTSSVSVPILFQYYFETPHVGAAVPTLRVLLTPGWSEAPVGSSTPSTQVVTGSATVLAGITWLATHWLALRVIGGVSGGFGANVVGAINITGNASVQAQVSAVVRF